MVKKIVKKKRKTVKKTKRNLFDESFGYLKSSKNYIYAITLIFIISTAIGFLFPSNFTFFNEFLLELADKTEDMGLARLTWFIFQNNITTAFVGMVAGVFLGVVPIVNSVTNGVVLGYVFSLASAISGFASILYLLPHGIFELPAIFIALGLGLKLGMFIFGKDKKKEFIERFYGSLKVFLTVILPLLIVAAIIEGLLIVGGR